MSTDITEHPDETLPYVCDDCGTAFRYAIAASMCCSPLNDEDDFNN
ncbi:hypothetical protein ACTJJ4_11655 [Microbacterium sp. 22195]